VSPGTRPGYRHAALLFRSDEEFLARALPFLEEGLSAGEAGLVVCAEEHNAQLARALPDDAHVLVLPRDAVYTRAAHVGVTYERLVHRLLAEGARGTRLVSEPAYGSDPHAWEAWATFESVSNVTLAALRLSSVCGYDVRELSASMVRDVRRAHPHLLTEDGPAVSGAYVPPADLLGTAPPPPDPLEATPPSLDLESITDRAAVVRARGLVRAVVGAACPDTRVGGEFVGAVAEVVTNAFRYGGPPVHVRVWTTPFRSTTAASSATSARATASCTRASAACASCAAAIDDQIVLTTYGRSSGFCVDPIEKKPLNHFLPGTRCCRSAPPAATWPASSARTGTSPSRARSTAGRPGLARGDRRGGGASSAAAASPSPTTTR
jgi:hypothetical protein